jgi:hypothetical protein
MAATPLGAKRRGAQSCTTSPGDRTILPHAFLHTWPMPSLNRPIRHSPCQSRQGEQEGRNPHRGAASGSDVRRAMAASPRGRWCPIGYPPPGVQRRSDSGDLVSRVDRPTVPHRPRGLIVETSPQVRPLLVPVDDRLTGCVGPPRPLRAERRRSPRSLGASPPAWGVSANRRPILHRSPTGRMRGRRQPIVVFPS